MFEIPLTNESSYFDLNFDLEDTRYTLGFAWNIRMNKWFMSISTADGTPILMGQPVFVSWDMFSRFKDQRLPRGGFLFFDSSGANLDPERDDLGQRVQLFYFEESEVDALAETA
jgi:hypothetical protein